MVLIGYWPLNETSGSIAYDHSRNSNDGAVNNGGDSTVVAGGNFLGKNTYSFDGSNDYISLTMDGSLAPNNQWTISLWFKSSSQTNQYFYAKNDTAGDNWFVLRLRGDSSGEVEWNSENEATLTSTSTGFDDGNWHHAVYVRNDSDSNYTLYVDGEEEANSTTGRKDYVNSNYAPYIGAYNDKGSINYYTQGDLSEVRIYDHALTPAEIRYIYEVSQIGNLETRKKTA